MTAKFTIAADVARSPAFDPDAPPPQRYDPGRPSAALDLRPGRVVLIGAPPGAGKTAAALQIVVGVLQNHLDLRAMFACVEMSAANLLGRVVSRLAGVRVNSIADKTLSPVEKSKVKKALDLHNQTLTRLAFLDPPFTLEHLADAATEFEATLHCTDYLQRFGHTKDLRESLDGAMTGVRRLALAGAAVLAISSVSRQRNDRGGSSYDGLNMASFRGSAELEFGSDSAYILDTNNGVTVLRCVKNRYGKPTDVHLRFDGEYQRFDKGDPLDGFDAATGSAKPKGKR